VAVTAADGKVSLWSSTGKQLLAAAEGMRAATFATPSILVAITSDLSQMQVMDVGTMQKGFLIKRQQMEIMSCTGIDVCDISGKFLAASSKGVVAAGQGRQLMLWGINSKLKSDALVGHGADTTALCFSPDGQFVCSSSKDRSVKVWDTTPSGSAEQVDGHTASIVGVALSPDGRTLVSLGEDGAVLLWDGTAGTLLRQVVPSVEGVQCVGVSNGGQRVVGGTRSGQLVVWDSNRTSRGPPLQLAAGSSVTSVALLAQAVTTVVCGCEDGSVQRWDRTRQLWRGQQHKGAVCSVAASRDGERVASASLDQDVRLWDAATGQALQVFEGLASSFKSVAFDVEGRMVVFFSLKAKVICWYLTTDAVLFSERLPGLGNAAVHFEAGNTVTVAGHNGGKNFQLWTATLKLPREP
jgi:WD40 repeat protein